MTLPISYSVSNRIYALPKTVITVNTVFLDHMEENKGQFSDEYFSSPSSFLNDTSGH